MQCPNPACKRDLFEVRVVHKQIIKGLPMLPVELTCAHCKRKVKAWTTNQNLKDIHANLKILLEGQKLLYERFEDVLKPERRRGFLDTILKRIKTGNGGED